MAYKIIKRKHLSNEQVNKLNEKYLKQEISNQQKENKGKLTFNQYSREGTRYFLRVPQEIHEVGRLINYKGKVGQIRKVDKKGIYVNFFTEGKGINIPSKTVTFISEKEVEKHVYPENLRLPQLTFGVGGYAPVFEDF